MSVIALFLLQADVPSSQLPGLAFVENEYVTCLKEAGKYPHINTVSPDPSSRSQLASHIIAECAQQRTQVLADWQEHPEKVGRSKSSARENADFARRILDWITENYRQTLVMMPQTGASDRSFHN